MSYKSDEALKILSKEISRIEIIARLFKTEGGHMTPFGKAAIETLAAGRITHAEIAGLLDISRGAVSAYLKKVETKEVSPALRS